MDKLQENKVMSVSHIAIIRVLWGWIKSTFFFVTGQEGIFPPHRGHSYSQSLTGCDVTKSGRVPCEPRYIYVRETFR